MKKLLILILIALLITLCVFIAINGLSVANIEILGIQGIKQRNDELETKIQEAGKLAQTDYQQAVSTVKSDTKKLEQQREKYESLISISTEGDIEAANQLEKYEIETLWVKLGNYATSEGAIMKMDVIKGSNSAQEVYDLEFTVNGSYISITDFISDIENDSYLGFKIEEFKMVPGNNESTNLQATFKCKNISIIDVSETTTNTRTTSTAKSGSLDAAKSAIVEKVAEALKSYNETLNTNTNISTYNVGQAQNYIFEAISSESFKKSISPVTYKKEPTRASVTYEISFTLQYNDEEASGKVLADGTLKWD